MAAQGGLNLKTFQSKLASLTSGTAPQVGRPLSFFSTNPGASALAPTASKAAAFPIVAILLVITIIVLYSTGRASKESIISLSGLTLLCLFGGLLYAFMPANGLTTSVGFNWKGFSLMFASAVVSMLVILLIVHYTIRPIFKVKEAGPGLIPVPTVSQDSTGLYWTKSAGSLVSANTVLGASDEGTNNYSLTVDILIKDPNVSSLIDRPIFSRSDEAFTPASTTVEGVSIVQQIGNYNLAMYLDKETNDLIVTTMSSAAENVYFENVRIDNVPVQKPFRIGVVMGDKYMEVYYNGKLHSTRQLAGIPLAVTGAFVPPSGNFAVMADVRNLRIWKGTITPAEMAYLPALDIADFGSVADRTLSPVEGTAAAIAAAAAGLCSAGTGVAGSVLQEVQQNIGGSGSMRMTPTPTPAPAPAIGGSGSMRMAPAPAIGGSGSMQMAPAPAPVPPIGGSGSMQMAPGSCPCNWRQRLYADGPCSCPCTSNWRQRFYADGPCPFTCTSNWRQRFYADGSCTCPCTSNWRQRQ
jgi:hypothetical protein